MPLCCGKPRKTAFCADCGRPTADKTPADELLEYCRAREKSNRETAAGWLENAASETGPALKAENHSKAKTSEATADQWKSWGDALAALIEKATPLKGVGK